MSEPNQNKMDSEFYEVLEKIQEEHDSNCTLQAAFTPNNGIRISVHNKDADYEDFASFDFTNDQAEHIGQALVRWAQRRRAEGERTRCHA